MADRAVSDNDSTESIVDLVNDDRWQARLEEARARREVALREKAKDDNTAPKRRLMPWEKDESVPEAKIEPLVQAAASDRVDFADRVDVMRDTIKKEEPEKLPATSASSMALPTSFEDLLTDDALVEDDMNWVPQPKKVHSAVSDDAPDVIELASRYASTLTAVPHVSPFDDEVEVAEEEEIAAVTAALVPATVRNHPPALLIVCILALAALPFAQTVPPLDKGPSMPATPTLRLQPALGFTTAMLWRPKETSSEYWAPAASLVLPLSTVFAPQVAQIETTPDSLELPEIGQPTSGFTAPLVVSTAARSPEPARLDSGLVDRLPDAFARRPAARPASGAPFIDSRAPARPPNVATGNDVSPRVAPTIDTDSTTLDSVTRLKAVSFDKAPVRSEEASPALSAPASVLQLTILVPGRSDISAANQFAKDATTRGHVIAAVKDVSVNISSRNLRFFHSTDRAEAERLAAAYNAEARDFTWYSPKPEQGTAELWLEGRASVPAAPVVVRTARREEPVELIAPEPRIVVVKKSQGFLTRLFGGHKVGADTSASGSDGDSVASTRTVQPAPLAPPQDTVGTDTAGGDTAGSTAETGTSAGSDTLDDSDTAGTLDDTGSADDAGTSAGTGTGSGDDGAGSIDDTANTGSSGDTDAGTSGESSGDGGGTSGAGSAGDSDTGGGGAGTANP